MTNKGIEALKRWKEAGGKAEYLNPWQKLRKKPTWKTAITAMCYHCTGWPEDGSPDPGIRQNIKDCTDTACPLHQFRPHR